MPDSPRAGIRRSILPKLLILVVTVLLLLAALPSLSLADEGYATWYGQPFQGRPMANGQIYDMYDPTTTACNLYPFGTWLKVTNPSNGRGVFVQVRDRGPFPQALDLSYAAFAALDDPARMKIRVLYEVVPGPPAATPTPTPAPPAATATPAPAPPAATPTLTPAPPAKPAPPTEYTVVPGDTLFAIARRFGLDAATLAKWNDLADVNLLLVGQRLVLQASSAAQSAVPSTRTGAPPARAPAASPTIHVVVEGDTLWGIAIKYGTTPARLTELNRLADEDYLQIGQRLRLPGGSSDPTPAATGSAGKHVVQEGDTLFAIAKQHATTVSTLIRINGLANADLLQVGQVLALP